MGGLPVERIRTSAVGQWQVSTGGGVEAVQARQYDVAADGRFLIDTVLDSTATPITIIQHWNPQAKK